MKKFTKFAAALLATVAAFAFTSCGLKKSIGVLSLAAYVDGTLTYGAYDFSCFEHGIFENENGSISGTWEGSVEANSESGLKLTVESSNDDMFPAGAEIVVTLDSTEGDGISAAYITSKLLNGTFGVTLISMGTYAVKADNATPTGATSAYVYTEPGRFKF